MLINKGKNGNFLAGGISLKNKISNKKKISNNFFTVEGVSDRFLLQIVLILVVFGVLMIESAGVTYSFVRFGDEHLFFRKQIFSVVLGLFSLYIFSRIDYHIFRRWSLLIYLGSLVFLVLLLVLPKPYVIEANGANRWLNFGFASFQPSEMVKLTSILYISAWCSSKGRKGVADFKEGFIPFILILSLTCILVIKQPDVGTAFMIATIAISIFFLAGAKIKHILSVVGIGFLLILILIFSSTYRYNRFMAFLKPDENSKTSSYQIKQALIAIGSGGIFGVGPGKSIQKALYLPEPVGDSIFAVIGEELGFIGILILLIIFLLFASRTIKIGRNAPDLFGHLIAGGIATWIMIQAFVNIAGNVALMPLKGIPLPFISYGGTSIVFVLSAIGILLNISRQSVILEKN